MQEKYGYQAGWNMTKCQGQDENSPEVDFLYNEKMREIGEISYKDFIHKELVQYSIESLVRQIPIS